MNAPTLLDIFAARRRIAGRVRRTPLDASAWLSGIAGSRVDLKIESLQVTHSFKARGAFNALLEIAEALDHRRYVGQAFRPAGDFSAASESSGQCGGRAFRQGIGGHAVAIARAVGPAGSPPTVVTASAGNHGRALAYAAETLGMRAIVFAPRTAPATKLEAIRRHGAELHSDAADYDEAETQAKAWAREHGLPFISPYGQPSIVAGAGTVGLEILEEAPDVQTIVVAIGGGGLVSGVALAAKSIAPAIRIVGVESAASCVFAASVREGRVVRIVPGETIADGLGGNLDPDSITFDIVRGWVDELVQVDDAEIEEAIRGLAREEHLIAEGAGAASVAALLGGKVKPRGRTAVVVSGGNIDAPVLARVLTGR